MSTPLEASAQSSHCATGTAVSDAANNPGLVTDCDVLLAARDTLAGSAPLNWSVDADIGSWDGVTRGGTPQRVTGLDLSSSELTGAIPPELGNLTNLTGLRLENNRLTGMIPTQLGSLTNLEILKLGSNRLTGCVPALLRSVADNDLVTLGIPFCDMLGGSPVAVIRFKSAAGILVRLGVPSSLEVRFNEPLTGFALEDISVVNGVASNFAGSGDAYTFDVTPDAVGGVTVKIAEGAAQDASGNDNITARLSFGIPYDDDGDNGISKSEAITAINDYLFKGTISKADTIRVINLYLFPTFTPTFTPAFTAASFDELRYSITFNEGWVQDPNTQTHRYSRTNPWSFLWVKPSGSGRDGTLKQHAESVRDRLEQEVWEQWPSYSLFELTSFGEIQVGGQDLYEITYRMQVSPEYCVVAAVERIASYEAWYGALRAVRLINQMCERDADRHSGPRKALLDSFRVSAKPPDYYKQPLMSDGVLIKAAGKVDPAALSAAADIAAWMLDGRQDIGECMVNVGAAIAIIPKDEFVTTLPEFAHLKGRSDFTGRTYDSFEIRGLGAVRGLPVSATSEENLLKLPGDLDHWHDVTVHEFAHAIQNLCFTQDDHEKWLGFYAEALEANLYPGQHAMANVEEFFAVFSSSYFGATPELGDPNTSRSMIKTDFPEIFESLKEIYGTPAPLPP